VSCCVLVPQWAWAAIKSRHWPPFLLLSSSDDKGRHRLASAGSRRPDRCTCSAMSSLPCVTVALCLFAHSELALGTVTLQFSWPARAASTSGAPGAAGHRIHLHGDLRWCRLLVVSLPPRARLKELSWGPAPAIQRYRRIFTGRVSNTEGFSHTPHCLPAHTPQYCMAPQVPGSKQRRAFQEEEEGDET
jgi:hypothetical protein